MNKMTPLAFDLSKHARLKHWGERNCRTPRHVNYFPRIIRQTNSLNCCPPTTLLCVTDDLFFAKKSYSNEPILKFLAL